MFCVCSKESSNKRTYQPKFIHVYKIKTKSSNWPLTGTYQFGTFWIRKLHSLNAYDTLNNPKQNALKYNFMNYA